MRPLELIGLIILLAIPVIAIVGGFGPTTATAVGESAILRLEVEYPARSRFHLSDTIIARITNRDDSALKSVVVSFDESYLQSFSEISFTPTPTRAYEVDIGDLASGDTQLIAVEVLPDHYGSSKGRVSVTAGDERVAVELTTFTFP